MNERQRSARFAWLTLGASMAAASTLAWWIPREWLEWNSARLVLEPWRLMTAALSHLSLGHLAANLIGTAVVVLYGHLAGCGRREAVAWFAAWPLGHALLLLNPDLKIYVGLSGVLHAGVAIASLHLMAKGLGRVRWVGALVMIGLLVKIVLEEPWAMPVRQDAGWSIPVAVLAHATGALAGLVCGGVAWVTSLLGRNTTMD